MTTASQVMAGIETCLTDALVEIVAGYGAPTIGTVDDNADEINKPRRVHVVPVSDVYETAIGGGRCQRRLVVDIVAHWPRARADAAKMVDDAMPFEDKIRTLPAALAALSPTVEAFKPQVESGADFGLADVLTASWRVGISYRRS